MQPQARWLDPARLHLQHGPIDLVIGAEGGGKGAFKAAEARFQTVLSELMSEIDLLRAHRGARPAGEIARTMHEAVQPLSKVFVTPMAAVAGSVAQTVLGAMRAAQPGLQRAYVNNGGDIALHLAQGQSFRTAIAHHDGHALGRLTLRAGDGVGGIATSGRHGRSLSLGIADSVTVLAATAAQADVAATLIANAVDLPGHPGVTRRAAVDVKDDSDLGARRVVIGVGPLSEAECRLALDAGLERAKAYLAQGHIVGAALNLQNYSVSVGQCADRFEDQRSLAHV